MSNAQDSVIPNPDITTDERETSIRFAEREDTCIIFTESKPMLWRLMDHSDVTAESLVAYDGGSFAKVEAHENEREDIVRGKFRAPLGLLKIGKTPRNSNSMSKIVSEQPDVDRESFDD